MQVNGTEPDTGQLAGPPKWPKYENVLTNSVSAFLDPEFVVMKLAGSKKFPTGTEPFAPDDDPEI